MPLIDDNDYKDLASGVLQINNAYCRMTINFRGDGIALYQHINDNILVFNATDNVNYL